MIYGKIWCVVKPTVGIPLFLSAVAVSSFAVHLTILNNSDWLKGFYNTKGAKTASVEAPATVAAALPDSLVVTAAPVQKQ